MTKIPKTKRRKYGMNETCRFQILAKLLFDGWCNCRQSRTKNTKRYLISLGYREAEWQDVRTKILKTLKKKKWMKSIDYKQCCHRIEINPCLSICNGTIERRFTRGPLFTRQSGSALYVCVKWLRTGASRTWGCFIYILDSSNSSLYTFWTGQFGSSSRSNWTGVWTVNSNGSWTDKQSSHFSTAKATDFEMMLKCFWNLSELAICKWWID